MKLQRYAGNPILSPHPDHYWEDLAVFNPAAWYDETTGEVLLLYRAAESGPEYKCYFGLAKSRDGYHFERVSDEPVLSPSVEGFDGATIQDPRMIKMDGWYYVTYACRHYPFGQFWVPEVRRKYVTPTECPECFPRYLRINATLTGLLLTRDFKTWIRAGWLTDPLLDDRDVVLFPEKVGGKYVMMHRPLEWVGPQYGVEQASAWISFADDLMGFRRSKLLITNKYPCRTVRPWGCWGPIYEKCRREDPSFQRNRDFPRDMFNVAVGLVWQTSLVTSPMYLCIQHWTQLWISLAVCAGTSLVLKFTWYDKLEPAPIAVPRIAKAPGLAPGSAVP
jgi:predicted GH43/DUF377 family glycosyl hydrolase